MEPVTLEGFLGASDALTRHLLEEIFPAMASAVEPALEYATMIYWALSGYKIYAGYAALDWSDLLAKIVMTVAVFAALNWSGLASQIYGVFVSFMDTGAATIMAGEPATDMLAALFRNAEHISQTLRSSSLYSINAIVEGLLVMLINCLMFTVALFFMTVAKLGLALTMLLLPLFVGFAMFGPTRTWFVNWICQMMHFALMYILVVAIIKLGFLVFEQTITQAEHAAGFLEVQDITSPIVTNLCIVEMALIMFMLQVREWAGFLSSGATAQGEALVMKMSHQLRR